MVMKFVSLFVIISFKNHYLAKSRNFRSPILKVNERWERKAQRLAIFENLLLK